MGIVALPNRSVPFLLHIPGLNLFYTKCFYTTPTIQNSLKASRGVKVAFFNKLCHKVKWMKSTISLAKLNASFPYPVLELLLRCHMHRQHLDAGWQCCLSAKGQSEAVSHWFYTTGGSSHPVRGLQTSFPVCAFSHGHVNDLLFLLHLLGSSCPQASERSFVCQAVKNCPCHPLCRCVLTVAEPSPLAASSACLKGPWDA